ncbi:MAG TPA: alpha-hydroxy acid oxidase [Stellaceae bacterium]|nr:alpha-hydroxy acid oxidase [Stellaceae bacterium]
MASEAKEEDFLTLHELVKAARGRLPKGIWDYLVGGTETETTLRRNRLALDSVALRPRVLRDVSRIDATSELLGRRIRLPVALAPVGSLESFEAGGGASVAAAAGDFGVPMFLSSVTKPGLEASAQAAPDAFRIFQLYVRGDDAFVDDFARRAIDAGFHAFCLTVDTAIYSRRERDIASRFVKPWRTAATGQGFQAGLSWNHVRRFKDKWKIPLILKGIATAEDAVIACDHGVEAIYVSNHGGRQLDHGRGSLDVLPEVIEAVRGRAAVYIDGSFSRGTDVIKAIALGADLVVVGRLYLYGLAAAGRAGVVRVLELLENEITTDLGLMGVAKLAELDKSFVHPAPPVYQPHVHSAFPLIAEGY